MGSGPEDSTDTDTPTSMGSETDTSEPTGPGGDVPPVFEAFEVNGSTTPDDVTHSSMVQLTATVTDDVGVASVAFYDGDMLLGTVTEEPFELETLVTSVDNGGFVFRAVATDSAEQESESDEVQLFVDVNGGELIDVNEGLFGGCESIFGFGGIARIRDDRFVLAGTGCLESDGVTPDAPNILAFDDELEVVSAAIADAALAFPPTTLDDGRALVPTTTLALAPDPLTWRYNVYDPQTGAIDVGAGLLYSDADNAARPAAIAVPGEGILVARNENEVRLLTADLDETVWTSDMGVGAGVASIYSRTLTATGELLLVISSASCPGESEACIVKIGTDGVRQWTRPLLPSVLSESGVASDGANGAFVGLRTQTAYLVLHLNSEGDEVASELLAFASPPTGTVVVEADGQGGVVVAGAYGDQDPNTAGEVSNDLSFLVRLDESLEEVWSVGDFGPGQSRAVALELDGTGSLLVAGIRATTAPPTLLGITGPVWLGRVDL